MWYHLAAGYSHLVSFPALLLPTLINAGQKHVQIPYMISTTSDNKCGEYGFHLAFDHESHKYSLHLTDISFT
jgi:hypothetical protein